MSESLNTALTLLGVGMVTVFTILALIVLFGNLLIALVNKYFPEKKMPSVMRGSESGGAIDSRKLAAIVSAVDMVTEGKGKVTSVTRAD